MLTLAEAVTMLLEPPAGALGPGVAVAVKTTTLPSGPRPSTLTDVKSPVLAAAAATGALTRGGTLAVRGVWVGGVELGVGLGEGLGVVVGVGAEINNENGMPKEKVLWDCGRGRE